MDLIINLFKWATSNDWGTVLVAAFAALGALDAFLFALLKLSNLLFPSVTWDDNLFALLHSWISKIGKK